MSEFTEELRSLINRFSKENDSNTPDFILAGYILVCLEAFNEATRAREKWYGVSARQAIQQVETLVSGGKCE